MRHQLTLLCGLTISVFFVGSLNGQKLWTLQECLDHAETHNLQIEIANAVNSTSVLDRKEANQARYPSLNASTSYSYNFGRNIDPTTNDFVPQNLGFNSLSLNTNVLLYNGGRLRELYQRTLLLEEASKAQRDQMVQNVQLDIAIAYLTVLFETERKRNAEQTRALSVNQLDRVQKLIQVEQAPEADQYEWVAQSAQDEQAILERENAIQNALFQLRNLLNIDPNDPFAIDVSAADQTATSDPADLDFAEIYQRIVDVRPEVAAFDLAERAAEKNITISRNEYTPSLFFGASLSSNYSTLADPKYIDQLNQNLGFGMGVSLQVPIYDRGLKRVNIQRAENDLLIARSTNKQSLKDLELQVQQVLADLRNAQLQLEAGERRLEFLQNAYDNMDQRYELGMSNNYDLLDAQNRLNQGQNELTIAKYDLLFRKKILAFYLGEDLAE
ncbi:MAG: TolC family protein [Saprospiraceae bacterium]|nr:TolC family protein [Saprospiraceae bacterium]